MATNLSTPRTTATTVSDVAQNTQTGPLIAHLGRQDPHLHQALTTMQNQSNTLTNNVQDIVSGIQYLAQLVYQIVVQLNMQDQIPSTQPALPGTGGQKGGGSASRGSARNTAPIPPQVNRPGQT